MKLRFLLFVWLALSVPALAQYPPVSDLSGGTARRVTVVTTLPAACKARAGEIVAVYTGSVTRYYECYGGTYRPLGGASILWLPGALCNNATASTWWDLPTSTPAAAACVTGSNIQKGVLDFADTSGGFSAQKTLALPADFTGAIDVTLYWTTTATSGNVKWSVSTAFTATNAAATDDPAFNTASTVTTAAPGTANRVQASTITGVTATGAAASTLFHLKIFRDGNDAADTVSATVRLIGVEVAYRYL